MEFADAMEVAMPIKRHLLLDEKKNPNVTIRVTVNVEDVNDLARINYAISQNLS